jgi:hypothetical protein
VLGVQNSTDRELYKGINTTQTENGQVSDDKKAIN